MKQGKGWHLEPVRHSRARRFGSAGGKMPSKFNASGVAYSQGTQYWRTPQGNVVRVGSSPLLRAYPKIMKQFNQPIDKNKIAGKSYGVENFSTQELEHGARNVKAKSMESLEKELKDVYPNYDVYVAPMSDGGYLAHIEKKKADSVVVAKSEAKETPAQIEADYNSVSKKEYQTHDSENLNQTERIRTAYGLPAKPFTIVIKDVFGNVHVIKNVGSMEEAKQFIKNNPLANKQSKYKIQKELIIKEENNNSDLNKYSQLWHQKNYDELNDFSKSKIKNYLGLKKISKNLVDDPNWNVSKAENYNFKAGDKVKIPVDLTSDPYHKRGEIGSVVGLNKFKDIKVRFVDGSSGIYQIDAVIPQVKAKIEWFKIGKDLKQIKIKEPSIRKIMVLNKKGYAVTKATKIGNNEEIYTYSPRTREEAIKQENRLFG